MKNETCTIQQIDGYTTTLYCYLVEENPIASILLLHGMAEHHARYEDFAKTLVSNGINCYLYDHRGHGKTTKKKDLGFFAKRNGDFLVVNDAITILTYLRKKEKNTPLFLMGHSMGSIITRNVIQQYNNLNGIIICGTSNPKLLMIRSGLLLLNLLGYRRKSQKRSPFMDKALFGGTLYRNLNLRTDFDWLSNIDTEVDKYIADPYCGFLCTYSFYHDLLRLTLHAATPKLMKKTKKTIPIFIISGDKDPVGRYGKDILRLIQFYQKNGYQVTNKLYKDCRHEILNDKDRYDVMQDVIQFLMTNIHS